MAPNPTSKSPTPNHETEETVEMNCPNCHNPIGEAVMEDRWGTRFCSVWCCDEYHESVHAEMLEA